MSSTRFIEKLLDGGTVEWKTLDEISVKISSGGTPKTGVSEFYDGDIPWLRTQEVDFCEIWDTGVKITEAGVKSSSAKWIPANCVIIAMYGATVGKIGINKVPMTTNQACANVELDEQIVDYRYVFHFLSSRYEYIKSLGAGSQTNINAGIVKNLNIPIPCPDTSQKSLEIQAEIVRILDTFTAMTAELTAELSLRKKQYNYYRDKLLSFEEGKVEWKTLGDVFQMRAGQHISANKIEPNPSNDYSYPCFGGNGIRGFVENKSHDGEHLLIGRQGALCGNVQRMKGQFYATEHAVVVTSNGEVDINWAFHMLTVMNLNQYASHSAQPGLAVGKLQKLPIPLPTIDEQRRVATILDKFDTLTNSITEGLPREIELRQKQYEYYRDLLLSFPKPAAKEVA
ncbi:restriction endonuclease subunit S [Methylophaga sulfidovorans]|uniref:Type I restriction enzyme, S subunit n=1 Tax=Methylophaga sulfidovorans TaxID=45496 RepID=A0A1I3ZDF4_9GAMM|nr:restriction endonuclease subunit S [Methylophaga sulfidovorans]SFK42077.1 type I restriction enzyme, S subunit [Methylophaga sulfidovorans]